MADDKTAYAFAVLTVSTGASEGWRQDTSGPAACDLLRGAGFSLLRNEVVRDDVDAIATILRRWADDDEIPLLVTTGGTGLAPSDVTPEATRSILDREVPGIAESILMRTLEHTPMAMISRAVAGTRRRSLILNLPGSPRAVHECLEVVLPVLEHAIALLRGEQTSH
jgi:molybdenum cofactor synthesis domain-containing protein